MNRKAAMASPENKESLRTAFEIFGISDLRILIGSRTPLPSGAPIGGLDLLKQKST
jgi:hypothetical protein